MHVLPPMFSNFFKSFHTNAAENDPQWQIWPKKWLRLGQKGHFCIFFYLFPQNEVEIDSEWSISPDSQLFPSFATKVSHFWRNLKNFHFWGGANFFSTLANFFSFHIFLEESQKLGGTLANFLSFPTFSNRFTPMQLKMTHNGKFGQKSGLDWVKMAIFAFFLEKSQKLGGGYIGKFFEFSNFFKSFHTNAAKNDPQWQIWPKKWLRLGQKGHFCIFFYLSPKMRLRLTWNGQFHLIHNFSHLLPPKCLIFGEISKIFISGGVHRQIFLVFQLFQIVSHQCG